MTKQNCKNQIQKNKDKIAEKYEILNTLKDLLENYRKLEKLSDRYNSLTRKSVAGDEIKDEINKVKGEIDNLKKMNKNYRARISAHNAFDKLWKEGPYSQDEAYEKLAEWLGIPEEEAHMSEMGYDRCIETAMTCREKHPELYN